MVPRSETATRALETPTRPAASRTLFDNLVNEIDFELGELQGVEDETAERTISDDERISADCGSSADLDGADDEDDLIPLAPISPRNEHGGLRPADASSQDQEDAESFNDPYSDIRLIPFVGEDTEDEPLYVAMDDSSGRDEMIAGVVEGDSSETEDLIVAAAAPEVDRTAPITAVAVPSLTDESLGTAPTLPPRGEITRIALGTQRPAPRKIGRGRLVPARLTWKPGDPFGGGKSASRHRFRWELMLTTACGTAVCGMICLALMRMVLS